MSGKHGAQSHEHRKDRPETGKNLRINDDRPRENYGGYGQPKLEEPEHYYISKTPGMTPKMARPQSG